MISRRALVTAAIPLVAVPAGLLAGATIGVVVATVHHARYVCRKAPAMTAPQQPAPSEKLYRIVVRATGEVRDADGNLLSSPELKGVPKDVTADQLRAMGLEPPTEG